MNKVIKSVVGVFAAGVLALVTAIATGTAGKILDSFTKGNPYEVSVEANLDAYRSQAGPHFLFPVSSPNELTDPPSDTEESGKFWEWSRKNGGMDLYFSEFRLAVTARTVPVIVQGIDVEIVGMFAPMTGVSVTRPVGGQMSIQGLYVDIEKRSVGAVVNPEDGVTVGKEQDDFAFSVAPGQTELFSIVGMSCHCSWRLELNLLVDGKKNSVQLDDMGQPFVTLSSAKTTATDYRWSPEAGWQPTGR